LVETLELKTANKLLESELKLTKQENELTKQSLESKLAFQTLAHDNQVSHLALSNDLRQKEARISELEVMLQRASQESNSLQAKLSEQGEATAKQPQDKEVLECPSQRPKPPCKRAEVRRQQRPSLSGLGIIPHLLAIVLEMVGGKTLLLDVPLVCKEWKAVCREEAVSAVMEFEKFGMGTVNDYALLVMLQRFPATSKIDISGEKEILPAWRVAAIFDAPPPPPVSSRLQQFAKHVLGIVCHRNDVQESGVVGHWRCRREHAPAGRICF
jgi:hypothetical protein